MFWKTKKKVNPRLEIQAWHLTSGLKVRENDFSGHFIGIRYRLDQILSDALGGQIEFGEEHKAAQILYDHSRDILPVSKSNQGGKILADVVSELEGIIYKIKETGIVSPAMAAPFPAPVKWEIEYGLKRKDAASTINFLEAVLPKYRQIKSSHTVRSNRRAYKVALALRAIFEHYSEYPISIIQKKNAGSCFEKPRYPITDSKNYGHPSGLFMKTLDKIYKTVSIDATLHHYAGLAKKCREDDILLGEYKKLMRRDLSTQTDDPIRLTEFGWIKNFGRKDIRAELCAGLYSYKEIKACHRQYLKTNASMTTPMKN